MLTTSFELSINANHNSQSVATATRRTTGKLLPKQMGTLIGLMMILMLLLLPTVLVQVCATWGWFAVPIFLFFFPPFFVLVSICLLPPLQLYSYINLFVATMRPLKSCPSEHSIHTLVVMVTLVRAMLLLFSVCVGCVQLGVGCSSPFPLPICGLQNLAPCLAPNPTP